jgi:hypothetical protein
MVFVLQLNMTATNKQTKKPPLSIQPQVATTNLFTDVNIEIGLEQEPFVVFVYFSPHLNM